MRVHISISLFTILSVVCALSAKTNAEDLEQSYQRQLEKLSEQTQETILKVEFQLASCQPESREILERKILEIKQTGEFERLSILLDWAVAEQDTARESIVRGLIQTLETAPAAPANLEKTNWKADLPGQNKTTQPNR